MSELRAFVVMRAGESGWKHVAERAGVAERAYLPMGGFPDEEASAIVRAAAEHLSMDGSMVLRAFGRHLVRPLVETYGAMLRPTWRTLDVIEHTEHVVHTVVRRGTPGAQPPMLAAMRTGPNEVVVHYRSARRLCHLAAGIVEGLGDLFAEVIEVSQRRCMLDGDVECQIHVVRRPPSGMHRRFV